MFTLSGVPSTISHSIITSCPFFILWIVLLANACWFWPQEEHIFIYNVCIDIYSNLINNIHNFIPINMKDLIWFCLTFSECDHVITVYLFHTLQVITVWTAQNMQISTNVPREHSTPRPVDCLYRTVRVVLGDSTVRARVMPPPPATVVQAGTVQGALIVLTPPLMAVNVSQASTAQ